MSTKIEIAWAAGLFEGGGSISLRTNAKRAWTASMSSTDLDVVTRFAGVIGVGKLYGPYGYVNDANRRRDHHKQYWRWSVHDRDGFLDFAKLVGPHLMSRRKDKLDEAVADMKQLSRGRWPKKEDLTVL